MRLRTLFLAFASLLPFSGTLAAQGYSSGDIYLISSSLQPVAPGPATSGIVRIDPYTGTPTLVRTIYNILSRPTFDKFRQQLVFRCAPTLSSVGGLWGFDAAGNATLISTDAFLNNAIPAAGLGGTIYLVNNLGQLKYVDAGNGLHDVLNAGGSGLFTFSIPNTINIRTIYFDAATNAIFIAWFGTNVCGSGLAASPYVTRVSLVPGGTQVAGPETTAPLCVALGGADAGDVFTPNTLGPGPNGSIYLSFDNNAYVQCGRMMTIDPVTLASSTYATTTTYFGCPAADAGCYSSALNRGLLIDTLNDMLRVFGSGSVGSGTVMASGGLISSSGGSAEFTSILEVPFGIFGGLANYGVGTPGCSGAQLMSTNTAPVVNAPNFYLTTTNCPPSSLGLILAANAPDAIGNDILGIGILLHIDLINSTELLPLDSVSNGFGFAASTVAIPIDPTLVGLTFYAQSIWAWTGCTAAPPLNLSSSNGLAITIQP
jgi:hypothetical protein